MRRAIDIRAPFDTEAEWSRRIDVLADDIASTTRIALSRIGEHLDRGYTVNMTVLKDESPFVFAIAKPSDMQDYEGLFPETHDIGLRVELEPHDRADPEKPVIVFENGDDHLRLSRLDPVQPITLRGDTVQVRQFQSWRLWNYHAAKKSQGAPESDYPGDKWQPEYTESISLIEEGPHVGEDLVSVLTDFELSLTKLQDQHDASQALSPDFFEQFEERQKVRRRVRTEVYEAAGFTPHQALGDNALFEAHQLLAAARAYMTNQ